MFLEIVRAAIFSALPVAIFTFLTLQWSISTGRMEKFSDEKELKKQFKKAKKKKEKKEEAEDSSEDDDKSFFQSFSGGDFLHSKIMMFGGGFYGTMALLTYIVVEIIEVMHFLGKIIDLETWQFRFSVQFIIDFIINSIMNLVAAFIWFITLPDIIDMAEPFFWLGAAYLGYMGGLRIVQERGDETWEALITYLAKLRSRYFSKSSD